MHHMRPIIYFTLFMLIGLFIACDSNTASKEKKSSTHGDELILPINIQKGGDYKSLQDIRNQTRAMIDFRVSENPEALSMITYGYWEPEFVFNAGKMSKEFEYLGYWIDFKEDFTYEYGYFNKTEGTGKYHFRLDDFAMLMLDDDEELEPKVWTANHNGDAMALVGKHDFGINNGMQIKMIPIDKKPVKK